ncbi:MAG: hypothetical protein GX138_00125, partial [Firmicutes bacterium]|nr:hypothetical protein [Bacillota bacterium]
TIEVRRKIHGRGRVLVEPGQTVNFFDTIAIIEYLPGRLVRCDVSFELGCEPQNVSQYISHKPGQWIEQGTELVNYNRFFTKRVALSPISGFYVFASKVLGYIFIREPLLLDKDRLKTNMKKSFEELESNKNSKTPTEEATTINYGTLFYDNFLEQAQNNAVGKLGTAEENLGVGQLKAGFTGVISSIEPDKEIVISSEGYRFLGMLGYGQQNFGKLVFLESLDDELHETEVPKDLRGAIAVIRGWPSLKALQKIEQVGALGLVTGSIPLEVLRNFCPQEPLLNLGHQMPISMTIIMMQKFGEVMTKEQYTKLKFLAGKWCLVDGNTQLRAGCKRPEVLVPIYSEVAHEV